MKQASTESGFAEVMGISQKVEDMINTNPLDFMLNFQKEGMNATDTAKLWRPWISADGANKVIGAMVTIQHALES
jgi:hypothetical protein